MKKNLKAIAFLLFAVASFAVAGCTHDDPEEEMPPLPAVDSENGALKGLFTLTDGSQVRFSQGNLQYQGSTKTWRFAERQWYFVGRENEKINDSYDGWIDLFGWGTSGFNNVNPYTSTFNLDYYNNQVSGIEGSNYDWGIYNSISNGGNQSGQWFTLSIADWDYILNGREGWRYAKAVLDGVNGLVLFPDGWDEGLFSFSGVNDDESDYVNELSVTDWVTILEAKGAVFLPSGGFRHGSRMYGEGETGKYWSTTHDEYESGSACCVCFDYWKVELTDGYSSNICYGNSVRLVRHAN